MIRKRKLTKRQAKKYAEMSGFPNTGNVELHIVDDKTWQETMDKLYGLPKPK